MSEQEQRAAVVKEALSFLGTNYAHEGRIKIKRDANGNILDRGGVDCAWFPFLVYRPLGLIPAASWRRYPPDWFQHQGEERYLDVVRSISREVETPQPGDFAIWRVGRLYAHGAIVVDWPSIIHAVKDAGEVILDHGDGGRLVDTPRKFFTVW